VPGLLLRSDLLTDGWTASEIRHRLGTNEWLRVTPGIYIDRTAANQASLASVGLFIGGNGAALSHESAAVLHRFDSTDGWKANTVISIPNARGEKLLDLNGETIRYMRRRVIPKEPITLIDGLFATSRVLTMIDVAASLSDQELERVFESFVRGPDNARPHDWRVEDFHHLQSMVERHPRLPGAARLRRFLRQRTATYPTGSIAETGLLQIVRTIPNIGPLVPQARVVMKAARTQRRVEHFLDLLATDWDIDIETDGSHHMDAQQRAKDLERDRRLGECFSVLRFSGAEALYKPEVVVRAVTAEMRKLASDRHDGLRRSRDWVANGSGTEWEIVRQRSKVA
jgi:very-short-patch-repair endonuclease